MRIRERETRQQERQEARAARLNVQRARQCELRNRKTIHAIQSNKKLGAIKDIDYFVEGDFLLAQRHHELPNLYDARNVCPHCRAYRWKEERPGFCCMNGKVQLNPLPPAPPEIQQLYRVGGPKFLDNLRAYNNALALASLGCSEHRMAGFSPTFKIQGKLHHRIGSLRPTDGEQPKFAQIYFNDTDHEAQNRLRHNPDLQRNVVNDLQNCLHRVNPYVRSLKSALQVADEHPEVKLVLNADTKPTEEHARRYNLPTASEVAVIMPGDQTHHLDVILHTKSNELQRINARHRSYDPLHYVLLFPHGTDGYTDHIPHTRGRGEISPIQYYRFRLQIRDNDDNLLMKSRRLTQQYCTDAFAKAEAERLRWVRTHQTEIRADKYKGLLDAIHDNDEMRAGKKVILPPTIYGSPRWYAESFQDAMAIVRKFGKPDFFITFTCNPGWPEIKGSLCDGQQPHDRPDICVRVFNIKLQSLLNDLTKLEVLGKVTAYTAMKEDQKRGLPHSHILLIMADADKPRVPSDIDRVVCTEIPDSTKNPELYNIVTKHMCHGPCGPVNPHSPCMASNDQIKTCQKHFPKDFQTHTVLTNGTYPDYRRRSPEDGGRTHKMTVKTREFDTATNKMKVKSQEFTADNRWIVPYNPFLSLKYNAHLNVEVVISVSCVKYLYKYTCKGSDKVMVRLANGEERDITNDEVERYVTARYISASEAYWRMFEFKISNRYPPVEKLPLHLENEQTVLFQSDNAREVADKPPPTTKLTAYFDLNDTDPDAQSILYPDICRHYVWKNKKWVKRSKKIHKGRTNPDDEDTSFSDTIGRVPVINLNPHQSELYFMRMLLYHKPGATSFADLRTINREEQPTFNAACLKLGILHDDREIDLMIEEAALVKFGAQLRELFATILMWVQTPDPLAFWKRHMKTLSEDLMHRDGVDEPTEDITNQVLFDIQQHLERNGYDITTHFHLPLPDPTFSARLPSRVLREETEYNIRELQQTVDQNVPLFNPEQQEVYNLVKDSVNNDRGLLVALDAAGGTGKTFVLTTILSSVRADKKVALATATSGIAATLLPNGRTLHSRCKVPIDNLTDTSLCNISKRDSTAELLRRCCLLVVDEVTMANRKVYEAVDRTFQDIREDNRHFGGVTVVFAGDWRQILPVIRRGSRPQIIEACLKSSPLWDHVVVKKLATNMRVQMAGSDTDGFSETLLRIGEGTMPVEHELGTHKIQLDPVFILKENRLADLCNFVFGTLEENYNFPQWLSSRAILCPTNQAADAVNNIMMDKFPGQPRDYMSSDKLLNHENAQQYPIEFLNTITAGMPPHILKLKTKSPIMLLRNLDPANGHCNGTRYVIDSMHDHVIEATITMGVHAGKQIFIPRIPISPSDTTFPFRMQRRQFPIRPCFAMTANKSQGQTLSKVGLYLTKDFFSHGQLYVAMSRVGDKRNIKILTQNGHFDQKDGVFTDNVVYHEILS